MTWIFIRALFRVLPAASLRQWKLPKPAVEGGNVRYYVLMLRMPETI